MFDSPRRFALALSLSLAAPLGVLAFPDAAAAAPKKPTSVRDALVEAAKAQWDIGVALAKRGQWDGARAAFLQAYAQSKNPRVLFNVAVAEKNLGHYPAAIRYFRQELDEGGATLTASEKAEIEGAIKGLEKYIMTIDVQVNEPGAKVFVDNVEVGTAPLDEPVTVAIGGHDVRATKPGFVDAQQHVSGATKNPRVSLDLDPVVKTSRVDVSVVGPKSAIVKIDGKEIGPAPYKGLVEVSAQPHQFSAEAPGYVTATQSAVVREGESLNLTLQLAKEQQQGKLLVVAHPEGATIEIDGKLVGASRWEGPVEVGTHQIVVKKQGYYDWTYDVDVPKGGARQVSASLNEDRNTSFVPWLIGTVLVVGASTAAIYFVTRPKDEEPVRGTLPPFTVGTPSLSW